MATLPRNVQRQLEAADALVNQMNAPVTPSPTPAPEGQAEPAEPIAQDAPASPPAESNPPPAPETPPAQHSVDWEHKFKTLQGLFNAEVPKLQSQVKQLNTQITEAQTSVAEQKAKNDQAKDEKPEANPKDVEDFGADLVEMIQRQLQGPIRGLSAKIDGMLSPLAERLRQLEAQVEGTSNTVAITAEDLFFDRLSKAIPEWEALNVDQRFMSWLAEVDPVYGEPRQAALAVARQNLDSARVTSVFNAFKAAHPAKQPKTDTLSKQISPKSGSASVTPVTGDKPVITQADITAFYHDVAVGRYRGRDQEQADKEAVINLALSEGRIQ